LLEGENAHKSLAQNPPSAHELTFSGHVGQELALTLPLFRPRAEQRFADWNGSAAWIFQASPRPFVSSLQGSKLLAWAFP
jgi:hypothetical protein